MSPEVERLHTAARRYCSEHVQRWAERYQRLSDAGRDRRGYGYTTEAYRTFPRYQVLEAIRADIERLSGSDLRDLEEARELFSLAGLTAQNEFTSYDEPEAQVAAREEREAFAAFVREVPADVLREVEPLPYVRVLPAEESERVWDSVGRAWGLEPGRYWYPLAETDRADVEAFQDRPLLQAVAPEWFGAVLSQRGVERVWELREYGPEYELDVLAVEPHYNGAEGVWTSPALDWILYASHESSVTVGGWMLQELKQTWAEWDRHIWTTPFFE